MSSLTSAYHTRKAFQTYQYIIHNIINIRALIRLRFYPDCIFDFTTVNHICQVSQTYHYIIHNNINIRSKALIRFWLYPDGSLTFNSVRHKRCQVSKT